EILRRSWTAITSGQCARRAGAKLGALPVAAAGALRRSAVITRSPSRSPAVTSVKRSSATPAVMPTGRGRSSAPATQTRAPPSAGASAAAAAPLSPATAGGRKRSALVGTRSASGRLAVVMVTLAVIPGLRRLDVGLVEGHLGAGLPFLAHCEIEIARRDDAAGAERARAGERDALQRPVGPVLLQARAGVGERGSGVVHLHLERARVDPGE